MLKQDDLTPVIVGGARTPCGRFQGAFASLSAVQLGSIAIAAALERRGVFAELVEQVVVGQDVHAGAGQGPARQAAVGAGIPLRVPAVTINKLAWRG